MTPWMLERILLEAYKLARTFFVVWLVKIVIDLALGVTLLVFLWKLCRDMGQLLTF